MTIRAAICGLGSYLPDRVVENAEFEKTLDTSDEWIRARSGIERRRFAADGETTSKMAAAASRAALKDAGLGIADVDAIVVATSTPDLTFPSAATMVQSELGMKNGFAFDVQAVCAGFVFAVSNANAMIVSGQAKRVLVVGSETFSRILDFEDRATCVLFGDGAGAVILEAVEGKGTSEDRGVLSVDLNSDGSYRDLLYVDGGVSATGTVGVVKMQGPELFKHAVVKLADTARTSLAAAGLADDDLDWIVPHQANIRIIAGTAKKLGVSMENVIVTLQDHGNTSAASIPLALSEGYRQGKFKKGDVILLEAIGGGLAWGSVVLRW